MDNNRISRRKQQQQLKLMGKVKSKRTIHKALISIASVYIILLTVWSSKFVSMQVFITDDIQRNSPMKSLRFHSSENNNKNTNDKETSEQVVKKSNTISANASLVETENKTFKKINTKQQNIPRFVEGIFEPRKTLEEEFRDLYRLSLKTPYTPLNKVLELTNDSTSAELLRSGFGLHAYVTEKNETIWVENGVQYRPFPYLIPRDSKYYRGDFEAYIPFNETQFFEGGEKNISKTNNEKKIILWWQHKIAHSPIDGLQPLRACPDFPCVLTSDRRYTENSSVILVNAQFVNNESPPKRRPDQMFVHYQVEAPYNYWLNGSIFYHSNPWNSAFNWTMSYRLDSDVTTFHGIVRRRQVIKEKDYGAILAEKTGLVAWMVSKCNANSKRQGYVRELQQHIAVDIYGSCGPFKCARADDKRCFEKINKKYKFYLGFENNFCKDYITEKLFRFLDANMVLIARGYNTYSKHVPPEIFLNTANFKSPKDLADRIKYLDANPDEYIKILTEKDKYFKIYEDYPLERRPTPFLEYRYEAVPMCELCQRAWNLDKYAKTYPDMGAWFSNATYQCQPPEDLQERNLKQN